MFGWPLSKTQKVSIGKDVEKGNPCIVFVEM